MKPGDESIQPFDIIHLVKTSVECWYDLIVSGEGRHTRD
jgi:hypothetical protein